MNSLAKYVAAILASTALVVCVRAQSVIESHEKFDFSNLNFSSIDNLKDAKNGFALKFKLNPDALKANSTLLNVGSYFEIFAKNGELFCLLNFGKGAKSPSGRKCEELTIRIPQSEFAKLNAAKTDFVVFYDGVNFVLSANGEPIDREYPYGILQAEHSSAKVKAGVFDELKFSSNVKGIIRKNIQVMKNVFMNFMEMRMN